MEQQTDEWLKFRKSKIGASDSPIIMGVSPWRTPYQLWQEKLDLIPSPKKTERMERGNELEKDARLLFAIETGICVEPKVILSKEYDWMMASFDGVSNDGKIACEIKCPGDFDHQKAIDGQVPDKYIPQLQHQMKVLEIDHIYYVSYSPGHNRELVLFILKRDDKYIEKMIEEESQFYECIKKKEPPKLNDRDFQKRTDVQWIAKVDEWKAYSAMLKSYEKKEKEAREELIAMANDKNTSGGGVKLCKYVRKGSIDYSLIPNIKDIDLEPYRKGHSEYWKINCESVC